MTYNRLFELLIELGGLHPEYLRNQGNGSRLRNP